MLTFRQWLDTQNKGTTDIMQGNIIEEIKQLHEGMYLPKAGSLGIFTSQMNWSGCREQFHWSYDCRTTNDPYYYGHHKDRGNEIADLIYHLEEHLGIKDKTVFAYTTKNQILWIKPSPWWLELPMRHSFLTLALRAGLLWVTGTSWRDILLSEGHLGQVRHATERFLKGYTEYTGNIRGWHRQFMGITDYNRALTPEEIDRLLVYPSSAEETYRKIEWIAYKLWETENRPSGKDKEHWDRATSIHCNERRRGWASNR